MKKHIIITFLLAIICGCSWAQKRVLTTYLYPWIPNPDSYYAKIEKQFEAKYPDIDLQIDTTTDPEYYHGGLYTTKADVCEVDCIFLDELIKRDSIGAYPDQDFFKARTDTMNYDGIAYRNGNTIYAIPHWICGNFLFYNKEDAAVKNAPYLKDLEQVLGIDQHALTTDLSGGLTGGEMYVDGLYDEKGDKAAVAACLQSPSLDPATVSNMKRLLHLTDSLCALGDSADSRIKGFVEGRFRVHVGYAESTHDILNMMNRLQGKYNLKRKDLAIRDWPLSDNGSHPLGWVDALAVKKRLSGQKLEDAKRFIEFMVSDEAYYAALIPDAPDEPRYLLPAYKKYYHDPNVLEKAPLYKMFFNCAEAMHPLKLPQMNNEKLREVGKQVMKELVK